MFVILDFFQPGNYTTIWSAVISGVDAVSEISVRKSEIVLFCWKRVAHPLSRVLSSIISFCFLFIRLDAKVFFFQRKDRRGSSKSLTMRKRSSLVVEPGCTVCGELSDQLWAHELLIWEINIFHRSLFSDQLSAHCLSSYLDQWSTVSLINIPALNTYPKFLSYKNIDILTYFKIVNINIIQSH